CLLSFYDFPILSGGNALQRKCREIASVEGQVICHPARRSNRLQVPWSHRQRLTARRNRFKQRAAEQGQTDAPLQCFFRPGTRHFHSTTTLGDIEIGFDRPAVAIGRSDLVSCQLLGGRANQQRTLVGRVIHAHYIKACLWGIPKVQVFPSLYSHLPLCHPDSEIFLRPSFWPLRPRMKQGAMQRRATTPPR